MATTRLTLGECGVLATDKEIFLTQLPYPYLTDANFRNYNEFLDPPWVNEL